VKVEGLV